MALNNVFIFFFAALMVSAVPLQKRISQTISESTTAWVAACTAAGGASQLPFKLAAGGNCDQQNAADSMIDLAKTLNNDSEMIRLAQIFVQQPRNAPDNLQVPYCQSAPKNAELNGLFHCQFASSDFTKFSGDQTGNVPLGLSAVNPPGSCPALNTPVPDGVQLNTLVTSPGNPEGGGNGAASAATTTTAANATDSSVSAASTAASAAAPSTPAPSSPTVDNTSVGAAPATGVLATSAPAPASSTNTSTSASGFQLQNGEDAIKLNSQFAGLTASSSCTDGEQACVQGGFAQCVAETFEITQCTGGTSCFAVPLVNEPGTSITCTSQADATARITATGATESVA
ncbi:hypothetical protein EV361DRAFT_968917 [Lentinula raphanica]|nr:hypothetical protein EV361DRAFT_968917 [Lentinula raphanica]